MMLMIDYRLPSGEIVPVDVTAAKCAPSILFELRAEAGQLRGRIVTAHRVTPLADARAIELRAMRGF